MRLPRGRARKRTRHRVFVPAATGAPAIYAPKPLHVQVLLSSCNHAAVNGTRLTLLLYAAYLQASPALIGLLAASFGLVSAFMAVSMGKWIDRVGPRKPFMLASLALALCGLLAGTVGELWVLFVISPLQGLFNSMFQIGSHQAIGRFGTPEERTANFTLHSLGISAATFIGPMISGLSVDHLGHLNSFLLLTGVQMLRGGGHANESEPSAIKLARRFIHVNNDYDEERFWVRKAGRRVFTPIFLTIAVIGIIDLVFAVDSIPAIFGITLDPFIVFTSNVFAILGLRNLYFLLADAKDRFHYLSAGLAFVLMWIGVKMILPAINHDWKVPPLLSLVVVISILTLSIAASLLRTRRAARSATRSARSRRR